MLSFSDEKSSLQWSVESNQGITDFSFTTLTYLTLVYLVSTGDCFGFGLTILH